VDERLSQLAQIINKESKSLNITEKSIREDRKESSLITNSNSPKG